MTRPRRCVDGEEGFSSSLMLPLACLLAVPVLLAAALAREESVISSRGVVAARARLLAESAALEWVARAAAAQPGTVDPALQPSPPFGTVTGTLGGGAYRADVRALDVGGVPAGYDRLSGFPGAALPEGGPPVWRVSASGTVGSHTSRLAALVTSTCFSPPGAAAFMSGGPLRVAGPATIDGRPHSEDGTLVTSLTGVAAVLAPGAVETGVDVLLLDGDGEGDDAMPASPLASPEAFLGLPSEGRYLARRCFSPAGPPPWSGTVVIAGDYTGPVEGAGTLVIHNPRFDPVRFRASLERSRGIDVVGYDPAYSHLDPDNQPAILQPEGVCTFRGIIVADGMRPGTGSLSILGQAAVLDPSGTDVGMTGGMTLRYSPESVRQNGRGACDLVLGWTRETPR